MKGCISLRLLWRLEPAKSNFEIIVALSKIKDFKKGSYIRLKIRFARKWIFFFWSKQFSWWPWIQRKFLLVALKPLLAFSLMFSNKPGLVCSPSFLINIRQLFGRKNQQGQDEHDQVVKKDGIEVANLPSMMAMWPVWPKVNSSAGWLMLARVDSPCNCNISIW